MIGLKGSGADEELNVVRETPKAYLLDDGWSGLEVWLPKKAFDDNGVLNSWGERMYLDKVEGNNGGEKE